MSKKKGLGRDIENSIEIMEQLSECLNKFRGIHLKLQKGLKSNSVEDGDIGKKIEKAMVDASGLSVLIDSIQGSISGAKPKGNARFASQRVISKFLSIED
jgi:hypothetical protein